MKANKTKVTALLTCLFAIAIIFSSCEKNIPFEKSKWSEQTDPAFPSPYRAQMLSDLMKNYKLVGMKYAVVTNTLGIPDGADSNYFAYRIVQEYGRDIDPVYIKNLVINFSKDSIVTAVTIDEWKAKDW